MYQDGVLLNWHCSGWQGPTCQLIADQQERDNLKTDRVVKKGSRGASNQGGASRNSTIGQIAVGKFEKKQKLEVSFILWLKADLLLKTSPQVVLSAKITFAHNYHDRSYFLVSTNCGNFFVLTQNQHLWSLPSGRPWCRFVMQVIGVCMN